MMETRNLGNGKTSLLGFGLMRLPCIGSAANIDRKTATGMVDAAIEGGVNYFDTAYMYHDGESENFAGESLSRHRRDTFSLATKMPVAIVQTADDVERIFHEQLRKCHTDYFDYYLIHNVRQPVVEVIERCRIYEQLLRKKEAGYIRRLGFSFHDTPELLQQTVDSHDFDFAQIQLNYADWEMQNAKKQYEILVSKGIPVHVMEPVRGGALASPGSEAVRIFSEADPNASPSSWALRYAASLQGVQVVLSGMTSPAHVSDNIRTFSPLKPLTDSERATIDRALEAFRKAATIPCTACRYCMDCPSGVEIPRNLAVYNSYERNVQEKHPLADFLFGVEYGLLRTEGQASLCTACGQCSDKCPQNIDIPAWMARIAEKK